MKKTLFSILFSLALAASLAGCGGAASSTAAARASYSSMDSAPQAYAADAGGTAAEAAGTSDLSDAVQNSADLLPQDGRKITLQTDQLQIQMVHIQDHRLEEALVTVLPKKEDEAKEKDRG